MPEYYLWIETVTNGFDVRLWNVQNFYKVFDNFAFTRIYKYKHGKQPFLCMSAFVGVHQYNLILGDKMKELNNSKYLIRDDINSSIISL